jgi:hypothetical protein
MRVYTFEDSKVLKYLVRKYAATQASKFSATKKPMMT